MGMEEEHAAGFLASLPEPPPDPWGSHAKRGMHETNLNHRIRISARDELPRKLRTYSGDSSRQKKEAQLIPKTKTHAAAGIALAVLFAAAPACFASPSSSGKTTMKDVKQEVVDAGHAIKDYSVQERDKAVEKVKAALEDMDARIDRLETRMDENWHRMDQAARQKAREALKELRRRRNQVAEWYGGLKYSSSKSWDHMKKGFSESYDALRGAWEKTEKEWDSGKK
jgi:predicted phage tail protein